MTLTSPSGEFLVSASVGVDHTNADVTGVRGGGFVVLYTAGGVPKGQEFSSLGDPVGTRFVLDDTPGDLNILGGQDGANLAPIPSGFFVVADEVIFSAVLSTAQVKGKIIDQTQSNVTTTFEIDDEIIFPVDDEQVADAVISLESDVTTLTNDDVIPIWSTEAIAFDSNSQNLEPNNIEAQLYDASGNSIGSKITVNSTTQGPQTDPAVAALPNDGFVAVWEDESQTGSDTSGAAIRGQRFDGSGGKVGGEFLVNGTTAGSQIDPEVASLPNGNFFVTWVGEGASASGGSDIRGQVYSPNGTEVSSEFTVNTTTSGAQTEPSVTSFGGGFVVSWTDASQTGGDTSGTAIRAQQFDNTGTPVGNEFLVNSTTNSDQAEPDVSSFGFLDTGVVIVWQDDSISGTPEQSGAIRGQLYFGDLPYEVELPPFEFDLRGTVFTDKLVGGENSDRLIGDEGDDLLDGRAGSDLVDAGAGDDVLIGGISSDTLLPGPGTDRITPNGDFESELDGMTDTIVYETPDMSDEPFDAVFGFDTAFPTSSKGGDQLDFVPVLSSSEFEEASTAVLVAGTQQLDDLGVFAVDLAAGELVQAVFLPGVEEPASLDNNIRVPEDSWVKIQGVGIARGSSDIGDETG